MANVLEVAPSQDHNDRPHSRYCEIVEWERADRGGVTGVERLPGRGDKRGLTISGRPDILHLADIEQAF